MTSKFEEVVEVLVQAAQAVMGEGSPIQSTLDDAAAKVDKILAG